MAAAAVPAAVGIGSSIIGGIQGKGAAKKQEKLAQQQLAQLQPLINAQIAASQFGLDQARQLYPEAIGQMKNIYGQSQGAYDEARGVTGTALTDYKKLLNDALGRSGELFDSGKALSQKGEGILGGSLPYLSGAANALSDLQKFYRPFMYDGQRAIDRFLPGAQQIQSIYGSELNNVNQGYRSASDNIAKFAPRGGGRVSTLARADIDRQGGISDVYSKGKQSLLGLNLQNAFQAAQGEQSRANSLQQLGLGQGQLGLGTIGQGLNTIGAGNQTLSTGGGLAQNAFSQGLNSYGQGLNALGLGLNAGQGLASLGSSSLGQGLSGGQQAYGMYNQQANRAYGGGPQQGGSGKELGGYLVDFFNNKGVQDKMGGFLGGLFGGGKKGSILPGTDFNYGYGGGT